MANDDFKIKVKQLANKFKVRGVKSRYTVENTSSADEIKEAFATLLKELKKLGE